MDKNVSEYVEKQESPQKEICQELRQIIFETFPNIKEEIKWGVPAYDNGRYYMVALKNHVNLGFSLKGLSKEEQSLFEGSGKTMKHIKVKSFNEIDKIRIIKMLKMVKTRE
ncbi:MAG: DUF1801 domain-containing protein [Cyclobacteriaceae bacterium]|nr:DUF1801 domain-containing protein [Cyclobacteriaceae bacterium]